MASRGTWVEGFAWGLGALLSLWAGVALAHEYQQEFVRNLFLVLAPVLVVGGATLLGLRRGRRALFGWLTATVGLPFVGAVIFLVALSRGLSGMSHMH